MDDSQEYFEAATKLLLAKLPSERSNKYDDDEFALYELYIPQVLALERSYNDSQQKTNPLKPNMNFVKLLVNAAKYANEVGTLGEKRAKISLVRYMTTTQQMLFPSFSELLSRRIITAPTIRGTG